MFWVTGLWLSKYSSISWDNSYRDNFLLSVYFLILSNSYQVFSLAAGLKNWVEPVTQNAGRWTKSQRIRADQRSTDNADCEHDQG